MTPVNGDAWRWNAASHPYQTSRYISVIEHPKDEERDEPRNAHRVPFGFGVREPAPEVKPLTWEGDDA